MSLLFEVVPVIDYSVRGLCAKPYPRHKYGCPNFNKKKGCPPGAKKFDEVYDLTQPVYALVNIFGLARHMANMKERHPDFSEAQLANPLWWQGKARAKLLNDVKEFLKDHPGYSATMCPEAMGVEVTKTLAAVGFHLQWPPKGAACQVALVAVKSHYEIASKMIEAMPDWKKEMAEQVFGINTKEGSYDAERKS